MQNPQLRQFAPWALAVGVLGLVMAGVLGLLYRQMNAGVQISLIVGLVGLSAAILFRPGAVTSWAAGRQARYGGNTALMIVALIGILVALNYIVARLPVEARQRDLTEGSLNTLPAEAVAAFRQAPGPIRAVGFYTSRSLSSQQTAQETLDRFRAVDPEKLTYEFVDPESDPIRAREYGLTRDGVLYLEVGDRREQIDFVSDTELASALTRFAQPNSRVVYITTGRGEKTIEAGQAETSLSVVVERLKSQNYDVRPLNLQVTDTVPADAQLVIVAGPIQPLGDGEVAKLGEYLARPNAALVAMLDPTVQTQGLEADPEPLVQYLAANWGVVVNNDVILDYANSVQDGAPLWPIAFRYGTSSITDRLQNVATFFPIARSLTVNTTVPTLSAAILVEASDQAWGEASLASLNEAAGPSFGEGDLAGPVPLAATVTNTTTKGRVVVFGDSEFAADTFVNSGANLSLMVNSVNWATQDDTLINLTPRTAPERSMRVVDALTANMILFVTVIGMPGLVLVLAGVVWFQRRRHA